MKNNVQAEFAKSYEDHKDALFRHILMRLGGDREKALDLTSDTFARTWDAMCKGKEIENLRAYLYRVAHNLIVDAYGAHKTSSLEALSESAGNVDADGEALDNHMYMQDQSMGANVLKEAELAEIHRALAKLPDDFREVMILRYIDDLGPNEISEVLNIAPNLVSVRLLRASAALRKIINTK